MVNDTTGEFFVKSWSEVKVKDVEPLKRCVLLGKPTQSAPPMVVIPCASSENWSIERISQTFSSLKYSTSNSSSSEDNDSILLRNIKRFDLC
ncbi:12608_t:CDS:2 [Acaulospora morrowiae]|uniref:12608_t:CDS:1 n=1 Tax=Acaulospora morrowiae TaxID=94023 RepID=A0A9N9CFP9_9GLOM|nr:12608_t:CDS:2 [Acaulospora morrowiae]